jgi:hypothetical protein
MSGYPSASREHHARPRSGLRILLKGRTYAKLCSDRGGMRSGDGVNGFERILILYRPHPEDEFRS